MKTAKLLFGLATACTPTATSHTAPQYPLCDPAGAPACGNIGQTGRTESRVEQRVPRDALGPESARRSRAPDAPPVSPSLVSVPHVTAVTRVLIGASREVFTKFTAVRPLVDHREEVVCGNVMTKGGSHRVCRPRGEGEP
jgi:hypothetical protein